MQFPRDSGMRMRHPAAKRGVGLQPRADPADTRVDAYQGVPSHRHDAVGAELVAAVDDRHKDFFEKSFVQTSFHETSIGHFASTDAIAWA